MVAPIEHVLVLLKPDGVEKGLEKLLISRLKDVGLEILRRRKFRLTDNTVDVHYSRHVMKSYYRRMKEYMTRGPVIALEVRGAHAVHKIREIVGATDPSKADPTSIRGMYGKVVDGAYFENVVHSSDSSRIGEIESRIIFSAPDNTFFRRVLRRLRLAT